MSRSNVDNERVLELVKIIDDEGEGLTRSEINFIARIIDHEQTEFDQADADRVDLIYQRRVENASPEELD
jgi:hypothetical protein